MLNRVGRLVMQTPNLMKLPVVRDVVHGFVGPSKLQTRRFDFIGLQENDGNRGSPVYGKWGGVIEKWWGQFTGCGSVGGWVNLMMTTECQLEQVAS